MPHYFFNFRCGQELAEDTEGVELDDAAAARTKGIEGLRDILAADVRDGVLNTQCAIEIQDQDRRSLMTLSCAEVLQIVHGEEAPGPAS